MDPPARRDLARLPTTIAGAILAFLGGRIAGNPRRPGKPAWVGDLAGLVPARNGDYRILLRDDHDPAVSWIIHVDDRAHFYRPR